MLTHWNNSPRIDIHLDALALFWANQSFYANFIVFGLTRPGLEPTIYCHRSEHVYANNYTAIWDEANVKQSKRILHISEWKENDKFYVDDYQSSSSDRHAFVPVTTYTEKR